MSDLVYTMQMARYSDDHRYGPVHGASYDRETLCGRIITDRYWFLSTDGTGAATVTCKRCRKQMLGKHA